MSVKVPPTSAPTRASGCCLIMWTLLLTMWRGKYCSGMLGRQWRRPWTPTHRSFCGGARSQSAPIRSSSSVAAATAWRRRTTSPATTASPTWPSWSAAGGRGQHGPQHHHYPLQLPVGCQRRDLRARAQAVGGSVGGAGLRRAVQPARRAQPGPQPPGCPRRRPPRARQPTEWRRRGVADAGRGEGLLPDPEHGSDVRYPILGATLQRRGGIARHDAVAWAFARAADRSASISSRIAKSSASRSSTVVRRLCARRRSGLPQT
jgi:hypothetical protein